MRSLERILVGIACGALISASLHARVLQHIDIVGDWVLRQVDTLLGLCAALALVAHAVLEGLRWNGVPVYLVLLVHVTLAGLTEWQHVALLAAWPSLWTLQWQLTLIGLLLLLLLPVPALHLVVRGPFRRIGVTLTRVKVSPVALHEHGERAERAVQKGELAEEVAASFGALHSLSGRSETSDSDRKHMPHSVRVKVFYPASLPEGEQPQGQAQQDGQQVGGHKLGHKLGGHKGGGQEQGVAPLWHDGVEATRGVGHGMLPDWLLSLGTSHWTLAPSGCVREARFVTSRQVELARRLHGAEESEHSEDDRVRIETGETLSVPRLCRSTTASRSSGTLDLKTKHPVVIMLHGLRGNFDGATAHARRLASNGFVVVAVDHCDGSGAFTRLHDGRALRHQSRPLVWHQSDYRAFRRAQLNVRVRELDAVLRELRTWQKSHRLLKGRLDLDRVALHGHSFGAATIATFLSRVHHKDESSLLATETERPPIRCAILHDCWTEVLHDDVVARGVGDTPVLWYVSQMFRDFPGAMWQRALASHHASGRSTLVHVRDGSHMDFVDAGEWSPLLFRVFGGAGKHDLLSFCDWLNQLDFDFLRDHLSDHLSDHHESERSSDHADDRSNDHVVDQSSEHVVTHRATRRRQSEHASPLLPPRLRRRRVPSAMSLTPPMFQETVNSSSSKKERSLSSDLLIDRRRDMAFRTPPRGRSRRSSLWQQPSQLSPHLELIR